MPSSRRLVLVVGITVLALLAGPAAADAVEYCVPSDAIALSCTLGQGQATIQAALSAAQASTGVEDTVRIAAGPYSEANLDYQSSVSTNVVHVIGAGSGSTLLTIPSTTGNVTGLQIIGPPGSSLTGIGMTIPANDANTDFGIKLGSVFAHDIAINGPAASNDFGLQLAAGATLDTSAINLAFAVDDNFGVAALDAGSTIADTTVHADTGVTFSGASASDAITLDRTSIQAATIGATTDVGVINVRNSLIDLGSSAGAIGVAAQNLNNSNEAMAANLDGVTIVGGGSNSAGVRALADSGPNAADNVHDGEDATVSVANTILSGQTHSLRVEADRGETATLTTSYSNYDPNTKVVTNDFTLGGGMGTASYTASNQTNLPPGFVSSSDFHLAPTSQLIDIGDPAGPPFGATDIDGDNRVILGKDGCAARRDIGADEYKPLVPPFPTLLDCSLPTQPPSGGGGSTGGDKTPPETTIGSHPKSKTRARTATFRFSSSEPGSSFLCSYDGKAYARCTSPFTTPKLKPGKHRFDVLATDAAGNRDQSAATFFWKIKKRHRH
jgi:hypothetical protein